MKRRLFLQLSGAAAATPALPASVPAAAPAAASEAFPGGLNAYSWARHMARIHGELTTSMLEKIGFEPAQAVQTLGKLAQDGVLQSSGGSGVFSTTEHFKNSFRKTLSDQLNEAAQRQVEDLLAADNPNLSSKASKPSTSIASDADICERNVELSPPSVDSPSKARATPPDGKVEN